MQRRRFLQLSLRSLGALALAPFARARAVQAARSRATRRSSRARSLKINLKAHFRVRNILPGARTRAWSFRARVVQGDKSAVEKMPGSYLGPILRFQRGDRVTLNFKNKLTEPSIVHWHGLHVPEAADGHPRFAIPGGTSYRYEFEVHDRAGTYWYHPHPHGRTGPQVYRGLAGLIIITDDEEQALDLPRGDYDLPLVIQDRNFGAENSWRYDGDPREGFLGETILVNGKPDYVADVASRPYRLRLLNGSNSRIYKLELSGAKKVRVIGTDGGLLEKPVKRPYLTLGPAERLELWVDFSGRQQGDEIVLRSLEFEGGGLGSNSPALPQGAPFEVMRFRIAREVDDSQPLPRRLTKIDRLRLEDAVNPTSPKRFRYQMSNGKWTINDRQFEMLSVTGKETVRLNTMECWEVINQSGQDGTGEAGMIMPHPVHLHGSPFQILERTVPDRFRAIWETVAEGYVDEGWKDTVLLMPGERARFLKRFDDYPGLFLHHCHNLEHEDRGMMRNYRVV